MEFTAEYMFCAPGYRIVEFDLELSYDEEVFEFSGDEDKTETSPETADKLAASCAVIETFSLPLPEKLERLTAAEKKLEKMDRKNVLPWIFAAIAAVLSAAAAVILIISQKRKRRDRAAVMPTNTD